MLAAKKKRKHFTWVKQYIRDRHRYGFRPGVQLARIMECGPYGILT